MPRSVNNTHDVLAAPERNHYFYGKLMTEQDFKKETNYFKNQHQILNQLVLGSGVVCGLKVDLDGNGGIRIHPGLAIDKQGREIVVSKEVVSINPHQLTDDQGIPIEGPPLDEGAVTICLAFSETKTDPVPVLVPDCDTPGNCAHTTIREGFCVLVRPAEEEPPESPACAFKEISDEEDEDFFDVVPTNDKLHELLCKRISEACPTPPEDAEACVPLARVTLPLDNTEANIDPCVGRRLVYNNALLHEMILCLAERIRKLET